MLISVLATTPDWAAFFGRLHPLILHIPVGVFVCCALFEFFQILRKESVRLAPGVFVWFAALGGALSAATGYVLSSERAEGDSTLEWHRWLGIVSAVLGLAAAAVHYYSNDGVRIQTARMYRILLFATAIILIPAGHLGAGLTHGEGYLTEPLGGSAPPARTESAPVAQEGIVNVATGTNSTNPVQPGARTFASDILPIFSERCAACHNEDKQKGELELLTKESIQKGGKSGPLWIAGNPNESLLIRRVKSPLEEKGHMPPKAKPQPAQAEIDMLEAWVAAGAPFDGSFEAPGKLASEATITKTAAVEPAKPESEINKKTDVIDSANNKFPDPAPAIAALREKLIHAQAVSQDSGLLWIDFSAVAKRIEEKEIIELLTPLAPQIVELTLSRCTIGEAACKLVATFTQLRRLDLRGTPVSAKEIEPFRNLLNLEELVLVQTNANDSAVDAILAIPSLKKVYLWGAGVSGDGIVKLRKERPDLRVDAGDAHDAAAEKTEEPVQLTNAAPVPGKENEQKTAVPGPVNKTCPVTGAALSPKYQIVFDGKVVGFCCPNCPSKFWANPGEFKDKLK
ncbi:MAG: c-type cytochrome domain-containing protein [Planctomycetota bacterium]